MDAALAALLAQHPSLSGPNERGKLRCALTGHDVPARADAVRQFLAGKAYAHARAWYAADFGRFEPFIVPHKRDPKKLWCRLTGRELNRIPEEVEAHVAGRRYRLRHAEAEARRAKGRDPFAPAEAAEAEEDGGEDGGDLDLVEFGLIDADVEGGGGGSGGEEEGPGALAASGRAPGESVPPASSKRRAASAMEQDSDEEDDGDDDDDNDDDDDGGGGDSDDVIEVDDEFFAGNDAALAAAGLVKPAKAKRHGSGSLSSGKAARAGAFHSSSGDGSIPRSVGGGAGVLGKHGRGRDSLDPRAQARTAATARGAATGTSDRARGPKRQRT